MAKDFIYRLFILYADADRAWVDGFFRPALGLPSAQVITPDEFDPTSTLPNEFERAVTTSRFTVLVLSPTFLAGRWTQFGEQLVTFASVEESRSRLVGIVRHPCDLPLTLRVRVLLDCTDEANWEARVNRIRRLLDQPEPNREVIPCPYPGMKPFSLDSLYPFYGREDEIRKVVERLRLHRFLGIIGASGCGKTSLVHAGLIPELKRSPWFGPGDWLTVTLRPAQLRA